MSLLPPARLISSVLFLSLALLRELARTNSIFFFTDIRPFFLSSSPSGPLRPLSQTTKNIYLSCIFLYFFFQELVTYHRSIPRSFLFLSFFFFWQSEICFPGRIREIFFFPHLIRSARRKKKPPDVHSFLKCLSLFDFFLNIRLRVAHSVRRVVNRLGIFQMGSLRFFVLTISACLKEYLMCTIIFCLIPSHRDH